MRTSLSQIRLFATDEFLRIRVISGIALEVVDGGWIDGVIVSGIQMQRNRTPIFIRLENRKRVHDYPQHGLRNVSIENVQATESLLASSITGLAGYLVRDVSLSHISRGQCASISAGVGRQACPGEGKRVPGGAHVRDAAGLRTLCAPCA